MILTSKRMQRLIASEEAAVIEAIFEGKNRKEIAAELGITRRTLNERLASVVKRTQIDEKLFLRRIRIVYLEAINRGLLSPAVIQQLETK